MPRCVLSQPPPTCSPALHSLVIKIIITHHPPQFTPNIANQPRHAAFLNTRFKKLSSMRLGVSHQGDSQQYLKGRSTTAGRYVKNTMSRYFEKFSRYTVRHDDFYRHLISWNREKRSSRATFRTISYYQSCEHGDFYSVFVTKSS